MSNAIPLVSVVIAAFNCSSTIAETIQSVLDQTFPDFELIIVDDESTDDTAKVISEFRDDRIVYLQQPHAERAIARNTGILHSKAKYIAFVDSDDLWLNRKLEKQLRLFEEKPEVGLVYCDLYYFDNTTGENIQLFSHQVRIYRGRIALHLLLKNNFIQSPTVMVRRQVFDEVGLFDSDLPPVEDWDMWLRIASRFPIDYVAAPLARYRVHSSFTSWNYPSPKLYQSSLKLYDKAERLFANRSWQVQRMIQLQRASAHYNYGMWLMHQVSQEDLLSYFGASLRAYPFYVPALLRYFELMFKRTLVH